MSSLIAILADLLVAVLLVATITTSVRLSRRMSGMKADEAAMRTVIAELVAATDTAERAIAGLRLTVRDSEKALADRLGAAVRHSTRLAEQVQQGETVLARVAEIAAASSRLEPAPAPAPAPVQPVRASDALREAAQAARELAGRAARRIDGRAA